MTRIPFPGRYNFPRIPSAASIPAAQRRGLVLTPAMLRARARGPVVQRGFTADTMPTTPSGGSQACIPGYCFDDHGQICCVKSGNAHLCVSNCFAYDKPNRSAKPFVASFKRSR